VVIRGTITSNHCWFCRLPVSLFSQSGLGISDLWFAGADACAPWASSFGVLPPLLFLLHGAGILNYWIAERTPVWRSQFEHSAAVSWSLMPGILLYASLPLPSSATFYVAAICTQA
jgi:hypothetical protein